MSIRREINARLREGRLMLVEPRQGDEARRCVFVGPEIVPFLRGPWPSTKAQQRCAVIQANLEAFVRGDVVSVCLTPREHGTADLGRLDPVDLGVFDYRARDPNPGLRLLGGFSEPDVFVGLHLFSRAVPLSWIRRNPLLEESDWSAAISETCATWTTLFGSNNRVTGIGVNDFLTDTAKFIEL